MSTFYTSTSTNSSNASSITLTNLNTLPLPSQTQNISNHSHSISTSSSSNLNVLDNIKLKRCRTCNHAHMEGSVVENSCLEGIGTMLTFVNCTCTEYVPQDNLEYLEWKYNKIKLQKDIK